MALSTGTVSDPRSDADLLLAARAREAAAFGVLYERHAGAALVVARQYTAGSAQAEDVVSDAFAAVLSALQSGSGPTDSFRAYLFTVVRRVAAVQRTKGRRAEPTDDIGVLEAGSMAAPAAEEPAIEGFERSVVARAFASLPERWQAVLWHCEIEGLTPAEIAPLLGLSANSTAALAYRAREGLRQAYLQQHLQDPLAGACRTVAGKLGGYVRGGLGARDTAQVESHLEDCGECRGLVLELRDVNHGLRAIVAPLVLGFVGLGALKFALPTTGGLAAGTASLAAGGTTSGAAAGIAGGAGAASSTASGAGVVSGVGAGVAGASGGAASSMFGAVAGLLASVPTALVAGIAAVAVVAGVTVGALAISNGRGEPAAANPIGTATSSAAGSAVGATGDPSLPDGAATAGAGSTGGATSGAAALSGIGLSPVGGSPSTPAPSTSAGTPLLVVADPIGGLVLNAGDSGQVLAVDVTNTGTAPATSLVASVALPAGVVPDVVTQVAGRLTVHVAAASWSCRVTGGGVSCTLPVLDVGAVTRLAVQVGAAQDFAGGDVTWRIDGAGLRAAISHPSRVTALPWVSPSSPTTGTPTTTPTSTPTTTPTSTPTPTPKPTPTPTSTPTPTPTSTPTSTPTPTPTPTPTGPPRCQQGQPWSWWCWHGWHR